MRAVFQCTFVFCLCASLACNGNEDPAKKKPNQQQVDNKKAPAVDSKQSNSALAVFKKRIFPIFQAQKPSSCTECHLSGVDLKDYIHPSQEKTFASLVTTGMVDVENPDESKILQFINRKPKKPSLVSDKIRKQEYEAFRAWIHAAVKDPKLSTAKTNEPIGPTVSVEVIRHARKDRVMASFLDNIWTEVGRCAACHSPDRNQKQVSKHGKRVSWIKLQDPQGTMQYMIKRGLIDADEPEESLLLTKPTMQVKHGGGLKMSVGDRTYKQFRRFIDDYAAIVNGKYKSAVTLPKPNPEVSVVSEIWLKIVNVPPKYDKMLLQADLYRMTDDGWSKYRLATSDRPVFGKGKLWQHSLSLTAPRDSARAGKIKSKRLPPGRYLVKIYIDQKGKLEKDFTAEMGEEEFVGQVEITSEWPLGYGRMTVIQFPGVTD